jgi:hypothetical protein
MQVETKKVKKRKLNVQAMAVKQERVMSPIIADPGRIFVNLDIVSAEPMITALISKDPNYTYATYLGVGKKPFWRNGILMVPDLYLQYASVCPVTAAKVKTLFDPDEWLRDPEIVKKKLKPERSLCKVICLSAGYGVGVDKLNQIFRENGFTVSKEDTRSSLNAYWGLFSQIKKTIKYLSKKVEEDGYLVNLFGYRVAPPKAKDAFNAICQSSVAGLMLYCIQLVFERGAHLDLKFVTSIHDSLVLDIPEDKVNEVKQLIQDVAKEMNEELQWDIPIRFDSVAANNFYGLK